MTDFTVAIPTYNGASRLPKLLERLRLQEGSEHFQWEIVVVDNNSNDDTAAVVESLKQEWPKSSLLRYCFEPQQGLAFARQCAIAHAKGELVGFLDDDVLPAPKWVAEAYQFGKEHPKAGAYGGQIHGEFEVEPPDGFERIKSFLAIRERGTKPQLYHPEELSLPPGAALVIRKQAWLDNVPEKLTLCGRVNGKMVSGEDFEALLHIHRGGWQIWYCPSMHANHQIPAYRLEREYLIKLIRGCGLCVCDLRLMSAKSWQKPLIVLRIWLGSLRRLIKHMMRYRQQVFSDSIAAYEMEFLLSTMASPLYSANRIFRSMMADS